LSRPQDYTHRLDRQQPVSRVRRGGTDDVYTPPLPARRTVSIERNTLIDQTIDFPERARVQPRQIEIAADKATLIAQELVVRKCEADVSVI
jgi:hypothetical protein